MKPEFCAPGASKHIYRIIWNIIIDRQIRIIPVNQPTPVPYAIDITIRSNVYLCNFMIVRGEFHNDQRYDCIYNQFDG